jgi:hypothetical protein
LGHARSLAVRAVVEQGHWNHRIATSLNIQGILEILNLADIINQIQLTEGTMDKFVWSWTYSWKYLAQSAYEKFFAGMV